MQNIIILLSLILYHLTAYAESDIGMTDELFLKYGKSIRVGADFNVSVKTLEAQQFNCEAIRIGYDQVLNCQTSIMDKTTARDITTNNNEQDLKTNNAAGRAQIVRIIMGIEGELVTDYNIELID